MLDEHVQQINLTWITLPVEIFNLCVPTKQTE
jgi:hypothetical protein